MHLSRRRRTRVPRPASRAARLCDDGQDHGHTDPLSMGKPVERQQVWDQRSGGLTDDRHRRRTRRRARRSHPRRARRLSRLARHRHVGEQDDSGPGLRRQAAPTGVLPVSARADPGDHARGPDPHDRDDGHADHGGIGAALLRLPPIPEDSGCAPRGMEADDSQHAATARRQLGHPDGRVRGLERRHGATQDLSSTTTDSTRCPTVPSSRCRVGIAR